MRRIYIYSALIGVFSVLPLLTVSFLVDDFDYPLLGRFFLDVAEPFVADNGSSIDFSLQELVTLSSKYVFYSIVLAALFLAVTSRGKFTKVFKKLHIVILANLIGFYVGFTLIGVALVLVLGGAWANFSGF